MSFQSRTTIGLLVAFAAAPNAIAGFGGMGNVESEAVSGGFGSLLFVLLGLAGMFYAFAWYAERVGDAQVAFARVVFGIVALLIISEIVTSCG